MRVRLVLTGVVVGLAAFGSTATAVAAASAPKPKIIKVHTIPGKGYAEDVACPPGKPVAKIDCEIVGDTQAGGNTLSIAHAGKPGGFKPLTPGGLHNTCPTPTVCVIVGAESDTSAPGGAVGIVQWLTSGKPTATVQVTGTSNLTGVDCTSATSCVVAGYFNGKVVTDGTLQYGEVAVVTEGSSTAQAHRVAKTETLEGVSCGSRTSCVVVGFGGTISTHHGVVVAVTNGHAGSARTAPGAAQLNDVSCGSSTTCWASGEHSSASKGITNVLTQIRGGTPKHALSAPPDGAAIACVSATTCYLGGGKNSGSGQSSTGEVFRLVSGRVKSSRLVKHTMAFSGIACPTASSCIATGPQSFHNPGVNSFWRSDLVVLEV